MTPTIRIQQKLSWLGGKKKISTSTVIIATSNGKISLFVIYVVGMIGKEALFVIANLSQIVAAKMEEPILHMRGWVNSWITITFMELY